MRPSKRSVRIKAHPPEPGAYQAVVIVAGRWRGVVGFYDDDEGRTPVVYAFECPPGVPSGPREPLMVRRASLRCLSDYVAHAARWREFDIVRDY